MYFGARHIYTPDKYERILVYSDFPLKPDLWILNLTNNLFVFSVLETRQENIVEKTVSIMYKTTPNKLISPVNLT